MPGNQRVLMTHPTLPAAAPVSTNRRQFTAVWEPLGWQEAGANVQAAAADTAATPPARKTTAAKAATDTAAAASTPADTTKGNN